MRGRLNGAMTAPGHRRPSFSLTADRLGQQRVLRKYIDGRRTHLLDINTSALRHSSQRPKDGEQTELAAQLKEVRLQFDREQRHSFTIEQKLRSLQLERKQFNKTVCCKRDSYFENLHTQLSSVLAAQKAEENNREVYFHLIDRVRATNVCLRHQTNLLQQDLKFATLAVDQEQHKVYRGSSKEAKAKHALRRLKESIAGETLIQRHSLTQAEHDINELRASKLRKAELSRAQREQFENASIQKRSKMAEALREQCFAAKLWHALMTKHFEVERQKWMRIETAFQRIKADTGIGDVTMVVHKFLTKENALAEVIESAKLKESQLDEYKRKIEELQQALQDIKLQDGSEDTSQTQSLTAVLHRKNKELVETSVKATNVHSAHSKATTWLKRITNQLQRAANLPTRQADSLLETVQVLHSLCREVIQQHGKDTLTVERRPSLSELVSSIPKHLLVKEKVQEDFPLVAEL